MIGRFFRWIAGALEDERDRASMARVAFAPTLIFTGFVIVKDATGWDVPDAAYAILTTVLVGEIAWAGGNRVAATLAPSVTAVSDVIGKIAMRIAGRREGDDDVPS